MSAALQWNEKENKMSSEALSHLEVLAEMLRDVNLEQRMETLIKTENLTHYWNNGELETIRSDLSQELMRVKKMIFMLDQAQYFMELES